MWTPLSLSGLNELIRDAERRMPRTDLLLWQAIRIEPAKWQQHPWGDEGGGFWAVGVIGQSVLYYNDIEWGFNVSKYAAYGVIDDYWCNQDELHYAIASLRSLIDNGERPGGFGPPGPGVFDTDNP